MTYQDLVSIVVPTYNTAEFILECLNSIKNQSYPYFEILVVDDGSTDDTEKIVKEFILNDDRIRYFKQKNAGQSVARNRGLGEAKGKYVLFVDSDDWLSHDLVIEKLVEKIEHTNADFIQSGLQFQNKHTAKQYKIKDIGTISGTEILERAILVDNLLTSPCAKIYNLNFLKSNNLHFIEGQVNEDTAFSIIIAAKAKSVAFLDDVVYTIRERSGSTSRSNMKRMISTMHNVLETTLDELKSCNIQNNESLSLLKARYLRSMTYNLLQSAQRNNYKIFLSDYKYCMTETRFIEFRKFIRFLPFKNRILVGISSKPRLMYCTLKILNIFGIKMH